MKEYLTKNNYGNYELVYQKWRDDDIEIPEDANFAYSNDSKELVFRDLPFKTIQPVWQRHPENQNPLDDVKWFEGDLKEKKHNHYFKNVKHLDHIDVYRVLDLFEVVDPCIQHAIKKLLCAGMRGAKNQPQDVQEAIDSLIRYQEMRKEDRK